MRSPLRESNAITGPERGRLSLGAAVFYIFVGMIAVAVALHILERWL